MKNISILMFLILCLAVYAQDKTLEMIGMKTFSIYCNEVEMYTNGQENSYVYKADVSISFTPGKIAGMGIFIVNMDGDKQSYNVKGIHKAMRDGKVYYTCVDADDLRSIYVWRENYFFFTDGQHSAEYVYK